MKRKILSAAFCGLLFTAAQAQVAPWDSTYRPALYSFKVALYQSYPHSRKDIVLLGNSITDRVDWNELLGMSKVRNRGISGDITFGVLQRLDEIIQGQPSKVFILIGINDISRNIPDSIILENYRRMIHRIRSGSPRTMIYFQTLLPVNNSFTQFKNHYNKDAHILWLNDHISGFTALPGVRVIDLHPHFLDKDGKLDATYTEDGLHLNAEGYKVWAKLLRAVL